MIQVWSLFGHWQEAQSLSEIAHSWLAPSIIETLPEAAPLGARRWRMLAWRS